MCPNLEGRFPTLDATHIPVSRSTVRVTGPLMLTLIVRRIFQTARPTNFKLGIRMEDDDPHQPQAPVPPRSKVKVARSRDKSEPSWFNDVHMPLEAARSIPCRPNPAAKLVFFVLTANQRADNALCLPLTSSSAVAKRPRNALCY